MSKAPPFLRQPFQAPPELRKALDEIGSAKAVKTDAVLFKQGAPVKGVFLVRSGKIALSLTKGQKTKTFWVADAGSVLGLPAAVRNMPYSLTATAVEDTDVVFVSRTKAQRLLLSNPKLCFKAVQVLGAEVRSLRLQE
jgi:CRP-like cAMP-binding protein